MTRPPLPDLARALAASLSPPVPRPSQAVVAEQSTPMLGFQRGRTQRMSDTDSILRDYLGGLRA